MKKYLKEATLIEVAAWIGVAMIGYGIYIGVKVFINIFF